MSNKSGKATHVVVTTTEVYQPVPGKKGLRQVEKVVRTEEHYVNEESE